MSLGAQKTCQVSITKLCGHTFGLEPGGLWGGPEGFEVRKVRYWIVLESSPSCSVEDESDKAAVEARVPLTGKRSWWPGLKRYSWGQK